MYRHLQRRVSKAEQSLPAALKKRELLRGRLIALAKETADTWTGVSPHATAVAALVLAGEPKIDEPLRAAWARTLNHYRLIESILEELGGAATTSYVEHFLSDDGQLVAAERMTKLIEARPPRLTEIFRNAQAWLLKYTWIGLGAEYVGYEVPDLSAAPAFGSIGLKDANRWPRLPLGTMTAGDPVSEEQYVSAMKHRTIMLSVMERGQLLEALEHLQHYQQSRKLGSGAPGAAEEWPPAFTDP